MYSILATIDEPLISILKMEKLDISIILKIAILKAEESEIRYFHEENKKNIRLHLEDNFFFILNSVCLQNNSYVNEYSGELIIEMYLDIIRNE